MTLTLTPEQERKIKTLAAQKQKSGEAILDDLPTGLVNTLALFDGNYALPSSNPDAAVPGLVFPTGGFLIGRYLLELKQKQGSENWIDYAGTYGDTVIGFADSLVTAGQTLTGEEKSRVEISPTPNPELVFGANGVRRFAVVPAPSSVAVMALGGLMPLIRPCSPTPRREIVSVTVLPVDRSQTTLI